MFFAQHNLRPSLIFLSNSFRKEYAEYLETYTEKWESYKQVYTNSENAKKLAQLQSELHLLNETLREMQIKESDLLASIKELEEQKSEDTSKTWSFSLFQASFLKILPVKSLILRGFFSFFHFQE